MPRAKVNPKDRKRSVRACVPCKNSKIRCDGLDPCHGCRKRGRLSSCLYLDAAPPPQQQQQQQKQVVDDSSRQVETGSTPLLNRSTLRTQAAETTTTTPSSAAEARPALAHKTPSRMLMNAKGEQVYIGETASLSYLQFVRRILKQCMGPSAFTEGDFNNYMLEVEPATNADPPPAAFDTDKKRALIQAYKEATSGILDLLTGEEIEAYLVATDHSHPAKPKSRRARASHAAFDLALAIGVQCSMTDAADTSVATRYFSRGQCYAFEGMLCDPSLDLVGLFLLMAFYMLGACRRNAAFMYLGIASKAASALGLHRKDQCLALTREEVSVRLRMWKSLCVLDTIVSAILGRSGSSFSMWPDESGLSDTDPDGSRSPKQAVSASYEMCGLIDALEQDIWKGNTINSTSAEAYLHELRQWSRQLPGELRRFTADSAAVADPSNRELTIGGTHVACNYYFAVILATQPFLTSHLLLKLSERGVGLQESEKPDVTSEERLKIANLAQVCLDAATYMAILVFRAMDAGLLLKNMCLMQAWIFASGLLLGFSLFAEENSLHDTEQAFQGAQAALLHLSALSPQSKHYHDILSSLADAVKGHRQQRSDERRRMTNLFLDQVFTIDFNSGNDQALLNVNSEQDDQVGTENALPADFDFEGLLPDRDLNVDVSASLPMLWDDFTEDWQSLGMDLDGNWKT